MSDNLVDFMLKLLASEIDAVRKYVMYSCILLDQGYTSIAEVFLEESKDEVDHVKKLQGRLLFMDAAPGYDALPAVIAHKDVASIIDEMLSAEEEAIDMYHEAIKRASELGDYGNVVFFQEILTTEEGHLEWLRTQQYMVKTLGLDGYLQATHKS
ncbi:Bacterioferritin [Candidatus Xenohaliotis californiensis]|uniref:Bacterioferritin n=1 Tax=Candidatus Xenohaliotis californiensis TaxID=84677 RepID=A0ABP0ERL2_9RICK|nr:Bacterioferritin [Candidatus Xenohaliotis californiensis]